MVARAVYDPPMVAGERVQLRPPVFDGAEAAVHEYEGDAAPELRVMQLGPVDLHRAQRQRRGPNTAGAPGRGRGRPGPRPPGAPRPPRGGPQGEDAGGAAAP